ncbi:MAG: hypothetical protein VYE64_07365, partial [Planctomycetota bacterium]|nr:hypothetical protein [Planctomycetota bacterium]
PIQTNWHLDGKSFLGDLTGQAGPGRDWIYVWYARNGGAKGKEWARDERFKFYGDGRFFDLQNDPLEERPVKKIQELSLRPAKQAYRKLQRVLKDFDTIRPEAVAAVGEKIKLEQQEKKRQQQEKKGTGK